MDLEIDNENTAIIQRPISGLEMRMLHDMLMRTYRIAIGTPFDQVYTRREQAHEDYDLLVCHLEEYHNVLRVWWRRGERTLEPLGETLRENFQPPSR